jgi:osmotically-inducible protein OsmY
MMMAGSEVMVRASRLAHLEIGFTCLVLSMASGALAHSQETQTLTAGAIEKALEDEDINGLSVSVSGTDAVLTGGVRNVFQKDRAIELALEQEGVEAVDVDIEIAAAESDEKLGEDVVSRVRRYSRFTVFDDVSAAVLEGSVTLFGFVTEPYKKDEIERRLHDVLGIQGFQNQIEVLPNSMTDNQLRRTLANRLYRDSTFSDFASMTVPPIRIIVKNSRVLLTGAVNSRLAKQKAEHIIRQTPGVLSVENRLRIGN